MVERNHVTVLAEERIILRRISRKQRVKMWNKFMGLGAQSTSGSL
jgi:hypothetical protein